MRSSRVDIALIVDNGTWFSPPAYITILNLDNEIRQYDDDGAILSVDYRNARHRYTDPLISLPCNWSDLYNYDQQRRLTGWTRAHNGGLRLESFTWDGARVTARDAKGRPTKGQVVAYLPHREEDADGTELLELRQVDTRLERHYGYHSDDDQIGYIVREGVAECDHTAKMRRDWPPPRSRYLSSLSWRATRSTSSANCVTACGSARPRAASRMASRRALSGSNRCR